MARGDRPCPTGCGRTAPRLKLMCPPCWGEVPRDLQRDVTRTFRSWWADKGDADKLRAYSDAVDRAVGAIR